MTDAELDELERLIQEGFHHYHPPDIAEAEPALDKLVAEVRRLRGLPINQPDPRMAKIVEDWAQDTASQVERSHRFGIELNSDARASIHNGILHALHEWIYGPGLGH